MPSEFELIRRYFERPRWATLVLACVGTVARGAAELAIVNANERVLATPRGYEQLS